jgi:hypothetical protein
MTVRKRGKLISPNKKCMQGRGRQDREEHGASCEPEKTGILRIRGVKEGTLVSRSPLEIRLYSKYTTYIFSPSHQLRSGELLGGGRREEVTNTRTLVPHNQRPPNPHPQKGS